MTADDRTRDEPDQSELLSLSFTDRVRLAFRQDPTKGVAILLLLLLGVGFLLAFLVVFGGELLHLLARLLTS